MFNTRLLNVHDIILIGAIAIIVHILVMPMMNRIGINPVRSDGTSG